MQQEELEEKSLNPDTAAQITAGKGDTLQTRGIREEIIMNRWHLIHVLTQHKKGSKVPTYGDAWPWVSTVIALVLALVTSDFKNFLLPADTWRAVFVLLAIASIVKTVCVLWEAWKCRGERAKTAGQEVEEIENQLNREREKLNKQQESSH